MMTMSRGSAQLEPVRTETISSKDYINRFLPNELLLEVFSYTREGTLREEQKQRMIEMAVCRRWNGLSPRRALAIETDEEIERLVTSFEENGRGDQITTLGIDLIRGGVDPVQSIIALLSLTPKLVWLKLRSSRSVAVGFLLSHTESCSRFTSALGSLRALESIDLIGAFSVYHLDLIPILGHWHHLRSFKSSYGLRLSTSTPLLHPSRLTSLSLKFYDNPQTAAYVSGLLAASQSTLKEIHLEYACDAPPSSDPTPLMEFPSLERFSLDIASRTIETMDPPILFLHVLPFVTHLPFLHSRMVDVRLLSLCRRLQYLTVVLHVNSAGYRAVMVQKLDLLDSVLSTALPRLKSMHIDLPAHPYLGRWDKTSSPPFSALANHALRQTAGRKGVEFEMSIMDDEEDGRVVEAGDEAAILGVRERRAS